MLKVPAQWEIPPQRYAFRAGPQTLPGFSEVELWVNTGRLASAQNFRRFQNREALDSIR